MDFDGRNVYQRNSQKRNELQVSSDTEEYFSEIRRREEVEVAEDGWITTLDAD